MRVGVILQRHATSDGMQESLRMHFSDTPDA